MFASTKDRLISVLTLLTCIVAVIAGLSNSKEKSNGISTSDYKIQVLKLNGLISDSEDEGFSLTPENSSKKVLKALAKTLKNDDIKAVLLEINSPGGTVSMSQMIATKVQKLIKKDKLVVVSMSDVAASGGYYIASQANKIYALPGTLTGSIGVIMDLLNYTDLSHKIGVTANVIKSGPYKDIGSPFRPMTDKERELIQNIINDSYEQFVQAVASGRKMNVEAVKKIANGSIYDGKQALANHLVDELGDYDDALDYIQNYCKKKYNLKHDLKVEKQNSLDIWSELEDNNVSESKLFASQELIINLIRGFSPAQNNSHLTLKSYYNPLPLWLIN